MDDEVEVAWDKWIRRESNRFGEPNERERSFAERAFKAGYSRAESRFSREVIRLSKENLDLHIKHEPANVFEVDRCQKKDSNGVQCEMPREPKHACQAPRARMVLSAARTDED